MGLMLILLQANLYRLLSPFLEIPLGGAGRLGDFVHGATPSLVLPLLVFLGVHEHSMARAGLLSFSFGYLLDVLGAAPMFLFSFVSVALWWLARVAGVRLTAQTSMTRAPLALGFSLVESAIVLTLLAIFGSDNFRPVELATMIPARAISTAIFAPLVFALAARLHTSTLPSRAPGGAAEN
jgi:rod shape-determining protein MreD